MFIKPESLTRLMFHRT